MATSAKIKHSNNFYIIVIFLQVLNIMQYQYYFIINKVFFTEKKFDFKQLLLIWTLQLYFTSLHFLVLNLKNFLCLKIYENYLKY